MTVVSTLDVHGLTAHEYRALHNLFAPRLTELPALVASLPGAPERIGRSVPGGGGV